MKKTKKFKKRLKPTKKRRAALVRYVIPSWKVDNFSEPDRDGDY